MDQPEKLSKAESSRINGAQSRGPVTDAGKARSSMNNLQHGMYSSRVILDNENPDAYHALSVEYKELFLPQDIFEAECVDNMINSRWLYRRLENAQTGSLNLALAETAAENSRKYERLDPRHEQSIAYDAHDRQLERLERLQDRCDRRFGRAYRLLDNYRRKLKRGMPIEGPHQPKPQHPPENNPPIGKVEPDAAAHPSPAASIITKIAAIILIFSILSITPPAVVAATGSRPAIRARSPHPVTHRISKL